MDYNRLYNKFYNVLHNNSETTIRHLRNNEFTIALEYITRLQTTLFLLSETIKCFDNKDKEYLIIQGQFFNLLLEYNEVFDKCFEFYKKYH